ncbi:MAG: hypothetical protein KAY22_16920 [Rhizorhabdus sp.]|uniref:hypothetical protein n=1 Tax=Rhizorhabdus sp. TaxID=1968843 RepID=UPI001B7A0042|nr:hypothetical protein [Rhizorhabdus sp.]MBP8233982.1 hypothetical protein [Rhizorhabdus sp.]
MAGGWAALGDALGGNSEQSYQEGLHLGAQTQNALAQARARVDEAQARAGLGKKLEAMGFQPAQADAAATTMAAGGNLGDAFEASLKAQEHDFRARAGSRPADVAPGSIEDRQYALMGVTNGPIDVFRAVGSRGYQNVLDPEAGVVPLPAGAHDDSGAAAGIQTMRAFGVLDANDRVLPGKEALAYDIMRQSQRVVDMGGVPGVATTNPYGTPSGAPGGLGAALAPPSPRVAPSAGLPSPSSPAAAAPAPAAPAGIRPLTTAGAVANNAATIEGAKVGARDRAEQAGQLPSLMQASQDFDRAVSDMLAAPGFDTIYGRFAGSKAGAMVTPLVSNEAADAMARINQLKGQAFLQGIQKMRGLGQLSNQEGLKVGDAYTRATQLQQSSQAGRQAWEEVLQSNARMRMALQIQTAGHIFRSEAEAEQAGLAPGTPIAIAQPDGTFSMGVWE